MSVTDISLPLYTGCPCWPTDQAFDHWRTVAMTDGDECNASALQLSAHVGTHVDAPSHYLPDGPALDAVDLSAFVGPAMVIDVGGDGPVNAEALNDAVNTHPARLLLRTANSRPGGALDRQDVEANFCGLTPAAAKRIVESEIRLIGIDAWSIADPDSTCEVHRILLAAGVMILEGLDLRRVTPGPYRLTALPLKLTGLEASPVRAVLQHTDESDM